ncbi:MAG: apolipoprotein N-acyltransferase [Gammaproteobacteria bacterium]|nr:apolipoprotein N-acyltransferase [Gammaproteobacteria bacterium]
MAKNRHTPDLFPAKRPKLSRLIAFVLGSAMSLCFAPFGWSLLPLLLLLPLFYLCLHVTPRNAAGHAFWFGFGMFLTGTYWIYISVHVYGKAALWIALFLMVGLALIMAALVSISGWLISRLSHGKPGLLLIVAPAAWVLVEWMRGWVLTGFPWLALGYGQIDTPLAGWAPLLGVYGVSMMLALTSAGLLVALLSRGWLRSASMAAAAMPWLMGAALQPLDWTEPVGEPMRATIVQAGVSQDRKWERDQLRPIMQFYYTSTMRVPDSDIVLWPEVAIPSLDDYVEPFIAAVAKDATRKGQSVLFGILERDDYRGEPRTFNSVLLVGSGERQAYRKRHLVPFGEYFPVPDRVRAWMKMQNLPYSDLAAGDEKQSLLVANNGVQMATAICYEDAYGAEQLYAFPDAGLIINVSNDAWFGDSIAPHQHLEIARMRALEVERFAIRSTNTGISAFIDADGKLMKVGRQFVPEVMTAVVQPRQGSTPYAAMGNRLVIGLCALLLAAAAAGGRTKVSNGNSRANFAGGAVSGP